ncbi:MAG: Smr/MutS family protein [Bacteroidetes bacterium]|nr:Smr/MutS family protein [Bacteroidota bacterium]
MNLNIGDKVSFLNEKGEGIITKIINKKMVGVTIEDGFELPFTVSELILTEPAIKKNPVEKPIDPEQKIDTSKLFSQKKIITKGPKRSKPHAQNNGMLELEINLHIEELLDNYIGMSNAEIIQVQLKYFQKALDRAISSHYRKLIVIHGVGNGRLKQEVRALLSAENNIRYYDASYAKYGYGATEVVIS